MAKFTVDTHLFRELGELLVSRESTALVELVKNSYDADATKVVVYGENLDDPELAKIVLVDDGNGMTPGVFEAGFLRIASRGKEGARRSPRFKRRVTGAKGVGRLAAHKLAWRIDVSSIPQAEVYGKNAEGVDAHIDWEKVESVDSLDKVGSTSGVQLKAIPATFQSPGTRITLSRLKKKWSARQRADFFGEIDSFLPPESLIQDPQKYAIGTPLFVAPIVRDEAKAGSKFEVLRSGDLDTGEDSFQNALAAADWIVDVDCVPNNEEAVIRLLPTRKFTAEFPKARPRTFKLSLAREADVGFQARVLFQHAKSWPRPGVRVYQEGFRVLPYGEQRNDWLELDEDYKRRGRSLRFLSRVPELTANEGDPNVGLSFSGNSSYFGAVFLTTERSKSLRMLVNREGFEWSVAFEEVKNVMRVALDLLVRERAAYTLEKRNKRRNDRQSKEDAPPATPLKQVIQAAYLRARQNADRAVHLLSEENNKGATSALREALEAVSEAEETLEQLLSDVETTRLLAALGLQLSAYLHEINGLMVMVRQIAEMTGLLRKTAKSEAKTIAIQVDSRVSDLRRAVERQAQYLADVTSADSRRRRSKQPIFDRVQAAVSLYAFEAAQRGIEVYNEVDRHLKTPIPMFSAELTLVFSNLLSNAIKAAGDGGKVRVVDTRRGGRLAIRFENTGAVVDISDSERWFKPYESTTAASSVYLGQGMGMGLPITRELLEDYGASVRFIRPSSKYATAIEVVFP